MFKSLLIFIFLLPLYAQYPIVIIDAGHGGHDVGTSNINQNIKEKDLNLKVALMVNRLLINKGIETYMTRIDDNFITLNNRVKQSNNHKHAIFVSIHFNYCKTPSVHGCEVYYCTATQKKQSIKIANYALSNICSCSRSKNRGVRHANFYVLKHNKTSSTYNKTYVKHRLNIY